MYFVPGLIKHIVKSFGPNKWNVTSKLDKPCLITVIVKWDIRLILLQRLYCVNQYCVISYSFSPSTASINMFLRQESSFYSGITGSEFVLQLLKQASCALLVLLRDSPHKDTNNKQHQLFSWNRIYYPPLFVLLWHFSLSHIIQSTEWSGSELQEEMVQWWISHWSNYKRNRHPSHQRNMHPGYTEQLL